MQGHNIDALMDLAKEQTTSAAISLRQRLSRGWIDNAGEKEAEALRRALTKYLKAIGEE